MRKLRCVPRRPTHPKKEFEAFLKDAEAQEWEVSKGKKYYKMKCPCGTHMKTIHLTPSDPNYLRNARGWLRRETCWKEES